MPDEKEQEQESQTFSGLATDKDVDNIVRDPESYGFVWDKWDAQSRTDKNGNSFGSLLTLRKDSATLPKIVDAELFARSFGWDKLVKAYNGTSGRVDAQGVTRTLLLAEWSKDRARNVTESFIRAEVVKRVLLGMRAKGGGGGSRKVWVVNGVTYATEEAALEASKSARRFTALDGTEHKTGLEAKQASVAYLVTEKGLSHEMAMGIVANMPE